MIAEPIQGWAMALGTESGLVIIVGRLWTGSGPVTVVGIDRVRTGDCYGQALDGMRP